MSTTSLDAMIPFWVAMFTFGFTGSLHCAGMCGPLAAASCGGHSQISKIGLYHVARIASYGILGLFSGFLGSLVFQDALKISSQNLALVVGLVMVLYASVEWLRSVRALVTKTSFRPGGVLLKESSVFRNFVVLQKISNTLQTGVRKLGLPPAISLGILTALLPCGFLYAALAQALLLSNPFASGVSMLIFAVATTPALFAGSLGAAYWQKKSPRYSSVVATSILLIASLSILFRGVTQPHDHSHHESHEHHHDDP